LRSLLSLILLLSACATGRASIEMPNYNGTRLYEVAIAVDDEVVARPRLIVAAGKTGSLEVPETGVTNGFSITVQEDGSLLTKVILVDRGTVIGTPEIRLSPNSTGSVELSSEKRHITVAVRNTTREATQLAL
jgi:hypothetical protein